MPAKAPLSTLAWQMLIMRQLFERCIGNFPTRSDAIAPHHGAIGSRRGLKHMSDASSKKIAVVPVPMADADILAHVDQILAKQPENAKSWGKAEHLALLGRVFEEHASGVDAKGENIATVRKDFMATMSKHGIGGNDSQFRQYLASKDGGNKLPEGKSKRVSDLLSRYD